MTVKEELHRLVESLEGDRALEALECVRRLSPGGLAPRDGTSDRAGAHDEPRVVPGHSFFSAPGIEGDAVDTWPSAPPAVGFDALLGNFWPEDESADEFVRAVRRWRREGSGG